MRGLENVPTVKIDRQDTTFLITFMPNLEPLEASIQLAGLLEPPILRERSDGKYQIICGFKRAEALHLLSIAEAESFVYNKDELNDLQALMLTIGHNLSRPLNLVEKALVLEKLLAFGVPEREVIDCYLPLVGLQPNMRILRQVTDLLGLDIKLRHYIVREDLSLAATTYLLHFDKEGQTAIIPLFAALRPGENRAREILAFLREISLRDHVSVPSLLATGELGEILHDQKSSRPQQLEALRKALKKMRYPLLTEMERKFADYRRSLALPPEISFHSPLFFESEHYRMELRFKDFGTFRKLVNKLHQVAEGERGNTDPLLELTRGR